MAGDDDMDAWGSELDEGKSESAGVSKDVLRKARALNPALAAQGSTTELFSKVKGAENKGTPAAGGKPSSGASTGGSLIGGQDFATAFYDGQQRYAAEKKRIQ